MNDEVDVATGPNGKTKPVAPAPPEMEPAPGPADRGPSDHGDVAVRRHVDHIATGARTDRHGALPSHQGTQTQLG